MRNAVILGTVLVSLSAWADTGTQARVLSRADADEFNLHGNVSITSPSAFSLLAFGLKELRGIAKAAGVDGLEALQSAEKVVASSAGWNPRDLPSRDLDVVLASFRTYRATLQSLVGARVPADAALRVEMFAEMANLVHWRKIAMEFRFAMARTRQLAEKCIGDKVLQFTVKACPKPAFQAGISVEEALRRIAKSTKCSRDELDARKEIHKRFRDVASAEKKCHMGGPRNVIVEERIRAFGTTLWPVFNSEVTFAPQFRNPSWFGSVVIWKARDLLAAVRSYAWNFSSRTAELGDAANRVLSPLSVNDDWDNIRFPFTVKLYFRPQATMKAACELSKVLHPKRSCFEGDLNLGWITYGSLAAPPPSGTLR